MSDTLSNYREQWALQDAEQDFVNAAFEHGDVEGAEALARMYAEDSHKQYPQYAGHWNGFVLGRVRGDVRTKGGVRFKDGDVVLFFTHHSRLSGVRSTQVAYSVRGRIDCSLPFGTVKEVV